VGEWTEGDLLEDNFQEPSPTRLFPSGEDVRVSEALRRKKTTMVTTAPLLSNSWAQLEKNGGEERGQKPPPCCSQWQ